MIPNPLPPRSERGQAMVLIVLSILGLIAITGLAVDQPRNLAKSVTVE